MLLSAENLSKSYGEKTVLSGVCFHAYERGIISIVGPSGEGKSTIARILCGTVKPDSGTVTFHNKPLFSAHGEYDRRCRRSIQLIPQQPYASLDPRQTIGGAITEPLLFHRIVKGKTEARKRTYELLEKVGLAPELYDRKPGELSGGQAQRALIARSLTLAPKMLIADEATSMLDVSSQAQIVGIFRQLVEEGLTILLISHDRPLVESVSDRIYHLSQGKMTEIDTIEWRTPPNEHA
jgi:peptide/nickel transport system ATP-binding protein